MVVLTQDNMKDMRRLLSATVRPVVCYTLIHIIMLHRGEKRVFIFAALVKPRETAFLS